MKRKQHKKPEKRLVRVKDAAHILGIPLEAMPELIRRIGCPILRDEWGDPCIGSNDFYGLHKHPLAISLANQASRNEAERRLTDSSSGASERFMREIEEKLTEYQTFIAVLERIHGKYLQRVPPIGAEAPLTAAYLLYGQVINLLNMGCMCLRAGYWNAGLVLRQIDEAIQVAEYFTSSQSTAQLQRDVSRWFRENRTPRPVDIRKLLADRFAQTFGAGEGKRHLHLMDELYERKSKWVHPAFSPIRETLRTFPLEGSAAVTGFDYGSCSYPRKLHEIVLFYRSSVWTAVQGFAMCFEIQVPMDPEDAYVLHELDRKFGNEPDGL